MKTDLRDYSKTMGSEEATDPVVMLTNISPMLTLKGGIVGPNEAAKIAGLMRNCKKLVGRCIYLNILRVTTANETLEKFVSEGGWKIMNKWLSEAKDSENIAVILEILKLLQRLPLRIQHLRENNTPKIVKHYAKSSHSKLKSSASSLMNSWMAIIRGSSTPETEVLKKKKDKKKIKPEKTSVPFNSMKNAEKEKNTSVPVLKAPSFAKFRKTGLETDQPLKKKFKSKTATAGKRSSIDNDKDNPVPEKKSKPNSEMKSKKITISEGFMDALNSASNPMPIAPKKIKRKPVKPASSNSASNDKSNNAMELISTGDANDFSAAELLRKMSPKGNESPVSTEPVKPKLNKYGKPRKTVKWLSDEKLETIRYFEIDENERVNVTKINYRIQVDSLPYSPYNGRVNVSTQSFKDAQHNEMMYERQLMKGKMPLAHEGDRNGGSWRKPAPIETSNVLVVAGCNSVEKDIQTEREKTVLMEIFLTKDMVPDSPAEPDPEPYEIIQPKIIPFDDENTILESMEPEAMEQENGNTGDDIIMKNMLDGIQQTTGDGDLTAKLKQILETATAITNTSTNQPVNVDPSVNQIQPQMHNDPNAMLGMVPGNPQMMPMQNMDMNGQNGAMPPIGFYGGPMMVPMQDPNFYGPNWAGPPPMHPNGPTNQPHMGPPPGMHGQPPPFVNNFNQGWNRPKWGPRDRPPRPEFRGNWRGRWVDNRRRR